jgi:hypothetical protein
MLPEPSLVADVTELQDLPSIFKMVYTHSKGGNTGNTWRKRRRGVKEGDAGKEIVGSVDQ